METPDPAAAAASSSPLDPAVRWVFFDLDGTLWDHESASQDAIRAACERFDVPYEEFHPFFDLENRKAWELLCEGRITREQLRVSRFRLALAALARPPREVDPDEMSLYYIHQYLERMEPFVIDGAAEVLRAAHARGLRIAALTNGYRDTQAPKLDALGARERFDFLWSPEEAGRLKPAPEFFLSAMRRAACQPREALMIGDSLEADIRPAIALGMSAWWLRRPGGEALEPPEGARRFDSLLEIACELGKARGE